MCSGLALFRKRTCGKSLGRRPKPKPKPKPGKEACQGGPREQISQRRRRRGYGISIKVVVYLANLAEKKEQEELEVEPSGAGGMIWTWGEASRDEETCPTEREKSSETARNGRVEVDI